MAVCWSRFRVLVSSSKFKYFFSVSSNFIISYFACVISTSVSCLRSIEYKSSNHSCFIFFDSTNALITSNLLFFNNCFICINHPSGKILMCFASSSRSICSFTGINMLVSFKMPLKIVSLSKSIFTFLFKYFSSIIISIKSSPRYKTKSSVYVAFCEVDATCLNTNSLILSGAISITCSSGSAKISKILVWNSFIWLNSSFLNLFLISSSNIGVKPFFSPGISWPRRNFSMFVKSSLLNMSINMNLDISSEVK